MTYASDRGLKVGSKIKTLEKSDYFGKNEILTLVVDDGIMPDFEDENGDVHPFCITRKWEHYKEPKLIWKEMTLEEVKSVQVGDKIRIDGVENEVTYTFNKVSDFGFRTTEVRKYLNTDRDTDIVDSGYVREMKYKFEKLVEETEMNTRLERDREYDVKLTGKEIFDLYLLTGSLKGRWKLYNKFQAMLGCDIDEDISLEVDVDSIDLSKSVGYSRAVAKAFPVPETEDQRKLRELKEKHAELGKAIDAMEKK